MVVPCTLPTPPLSPNNAPLVVPPLFEPLQQEPAAPPPATARVRFINDLPIADNAVLYWLATLCRATYADRLMFESAAAAVAPPAARTQYVAGDALTPAYGFIEFPGFVAVAVGGTTNLGQWIRQIFVTDPVPTNHPSVAGVADDARCQAIYKTSADAIFAALETFDPQHRPRLFTGHSMGGAVATVLHYYHRPPNTDARPLSRCATFGQPKAGDAQLVAGLRSGGQVYRRVALAGDFVVMLPPDLTALSLLAPAPLGQHAAAWRQYRHAGLLYTVRADGTQEGADEPFLPLAIAGAMVAAALGNPVNPAPPHRLGNVTEALRSAYGQNLPDNITERWTNPRSLDVVNAALGQRGL